MFLKFLQLEVKSFFRSPQFAAKGNNNYKVLKSDIAGKTQTQIVPLNQEQKLTEIAQLLSGSKITDAAILQAKELMDI